MCASNMLNGSGLKWEWTGMYSVIKFSVHEWFENASHGFKKETSCNFIGIAYERECDGVVINDEEHWIKEPKSIINN